MKLFGYKNDELELDDTKPSELIEVTLVASASELRKIARFMDAAANGMEKSSKDWEHEHLSDKYKEFASSPQLVIFNAEVESDL